MNTRDIGRLGEHFMAYRLESLGFQTSFVDRCGVDFWIKAPGGDIKTLEVKTSMKPGNYGHGLEAYNFTIRDRGADFYAFVAMDKERMMILGKDELSPYRVHRIMPHLFTWQEEFLGLARLTETDQNPLLIAA